MRPREEEWVRWIARTRRLLGEFQHLHDRLAGMASGESQAGPLELVDELGIDLVAVAESVDHAVGKTDLEVAGQYPASTSPVSRAASQLEK